MKLSVISKTFLISMSGDGYSSITIRGYTGVFRRATLFFQDREFETLTTTDLNSFFDSLRKKGVTNSTVQYYWKVIRSFYNFAEKELGATRPDKAIKMPKFQNAEVSAYSKEEVEKLFKACKSKRNKALILTLLDTGMRVSELCRVLVKDVNLETGAINVRPFETGLKSRARIVYIGNRARKAVILYFAGREDLRKDDPLIATVDGKMMERYSIQGILTRIATASGVTNVHPHRFRHTFAIEFLRNGGDVFTLQRLLGHNSLEMVRHYLNLAQSDIEEAYRKNSPADRMRL
jgi:integrase/recombinase XerD